MQSGWNTKTQTMEIYVIMLKIDGPPVILEKTFGDIYGTQFV